MNYYFTRNEYIFAVLKTIYLLQKRIFDILMEERGFEILKNCEIKLIYFVLL